MNSNPSIRDLRRTHDRILGGVCSGLARMLDLDPIVVRIVAVALTFIGPGIVLLYLAGWALLPDENGESNQEGVLGVRGRALRILGIGALVWGSLQVVGDITGIISTGLSGLPGVGEVRGADLGPLEALVIVTGLVFVGIAFLRRPSDPAEASPAAVVTSTEEATGKSEASVASPGRDPRGQRSIVLFLLTSAATAIVSGTALLLSASGIVALDVGQITALTLACIGVGLLVGSWWGRSRFLILVGLALVPLVLISTAIDSPLTGTFGNKSLYVESLDQLEDIDLAAGAVTVDVTQIESGSRTVNIEVGLGSVQIYVPSDAYVEANAALGAGTMTIFGRLDDGTGLEVHRTAGDPTSDTRFVFNIEGGLADVVIYTIEMDREVQR